jgi:hypothetical protein
MKKLIKEFHNEMVKGCYPIDPFPIYLCMVAVLIMSCYMLLF